MEAVDELIEKEEYIEAIEKIKDVGPESEWTVETLNTMALAQKKLHFYETAYSYYMLAKNYEEANNMFKIIPRSELEEEYSSHIHTGVRLLRVHGRRGVFATQPIKAGEIICEIPLSLCKKGSKQELVKSLREDNAYTRSMPKNKFPVSWDISTRDEISVSPLRLILEQKIAELKKESDQEDYLHLRSLVGSRCFSDGNTDFLVPFADMLNHNKKHNVDWNFTKDSFVMKTTNDVKTHEELLDFYGPKSNYEAFLHYGFVPENNTELNVTRLIGDLPFSAKNRLDPRYFTRSFEFELRGSYMEGTVEVFSFLRFVRSNDKKCPQTLKGYLKPPVNKENELWVCKMLYNMLQKEVQRRVEKTAFGIDEALAVMLLQSEMAVLVHWGEVLTKAIHIMEKGDRNLLKKCKEDYIVKVIKKLGYYK
jgi:hypothetical protein